MLPTRTRDEALEKCLRESMDILEALIERVPELQRSDSFRRKVERMIANTRAEWGWLNGE
jgi:glutathione S-transferase